MNTQGLPCHPNGITGYGNPDYKVMLIGIAPGRTEVKQGKPFVGESGRLLDAILKATGWSREQVYCTNLICTWNDEPSAQEIALCAPRLQREIEAYQPRLIITLGKLATEAMLAIPYPKKTFGQLQGSVLWTENVYSTTHSCYVLPTYHPAAILHGVTAFVHPIYRDLAKIKDIIQWTTYDYLREVDYSIAQSIDEAQFFIDKIDFESEDYIAVDIESAQGKDDDEMLDIFNDKLLCVAISNGCSTLVIPEEYAHGLNWHEDKLNYTGHNLNFDVQGINRFLGVRLPIRHDTMLASYNLDERAGVHSLKFLSREYLASGFYEEKAHTQAKKLKGYDKVDKDTLYKYNAYDACYTAKLMPILYERMKQDNVLWPYHNLLIPAANMFADMQYRGIKVDVPRFNELELKWYPRWIESDDKIAAYAESLGAQKPFNPRSYDQLRRFLFDILGLEAPSNKHTKPSKKHPQGQLSIDKEVLEELHGEHPFIEALEDYRHLDKIVTGYMLVVRSRIKLDSKLHAMTKQHGTVTGRTSMELLQTIPNPKYDRNAEFAEFRQVFIPENPDTHIIMEVDFSRAEMWWAVTYSNDQNLLHDLQTGDPHSIMAAFAFGKPLAKVTKQDRTDAKHVTFGKFYGRGDKALHAGELKNLTFQEVVQFSVRWNKRYETYMKWNYDRRIEARKNGELVSLTGRKRRFRLILEQDFKMLNEAINFPIQNGASDTMMISMIKLHPLLKQYDSYMLLGIHDGLVLEVNKKYLLEVHDLIKSTMEQEHFPGMYPVPVEIAIGNNWGQTHEITREELMEYTHA